MSFLIPAKQLAASYNASTSTLTLIASGEVPYYAVGIQFKRNPIWVGGLQFFLEAYDISNGSPTIQILKPYIKKQSFKIPQLPIVLPSNKVIIVTANHPNGVAVQVEWLEHPGPGHLDSISGSATKQLEVPTSSTTLEVLNNEAIHIDTVVGGSFPIKEALPSSPTGSIDVDFNRYRLRLDNALVLQGSIIWTFTAMVAGTTEILVDLIPSRPRPGEEGLALVRTIYTVNVRHPLSSKTPTRGLAAIEGVTNATSATSEKTLTFLDRVNDALDIVRKIRPEAEILKVSASPLWWLAATSVDDPVELIQLSVLFTIKDGTAFIKSKGGLGCWEEPQFTADLPPLGIQTFKLDGLIDIVPAVKAMRDAGYKTWIKGAELLQILEEFSIPEQQPYYNFNMEGDFVVKVGARDGDVIGPKTEKKKAIANGA